MHGPTTDSGLSMRPDAGDRALTVVQDLIRAGSSTVVLCTHREGLVKVLAALSGEFAVSFGHRQAGARGSAWVLDLRKGKLATVKYVAPGTSSSIGSAGRLLPTPSADHERTGRHVIALGNLQQ